jgi:hypothetical protein
MKKGKPPPHHLLHKRIRDKREGLGNIVFIDEIGKKAKVFWDSGKIGNIDIKDLK